MLEPYLVQLGNELALMISKDEKQPGLSRFSLDEIDVEITEDPSNNRWQLRSFLGPTPREEREAIFVKMLLGDLFFQGTMGSILGIDSQTEAIVLTFHGSWPVSYQEFHDRIEDFLNAAEMWKNETQGATATSSAE